MTGRVVQDTDHNAVSHHVRVDPCEISLARRTGTCRTGRTELVFHKITRVKQFLQGRVEPVKQFLFLLRALIKFNSVKYRVSLSAKKPLNY